MLATEHEQSDGYINRTRVPTHKRMQCWMRVLGVENPVLGKVAAILLSMHSTSCALEGNLSVCGRLYDRLRGKLHLGRGKMVYLAANDRIQSGRPVTSIDEDLPFNGSDFQGDDDVDVVSEGPAMSMEAFVAGGAPLDEGVPVDPCAERDAWMLAPDPNDR